MNTKDLSTINTNKTRIKLDNIINNNMNKLKQINSSTIKLNNLTYKGYSIGNIPKTFAFIYDENKETAGITEWFNHKGLTYVRL